MILEIAYSKYRDTTLTAYGMQQAAQASSPRGHCFCLAEFANITNGFIDVSKKRKSAIECLKEYPQELEICNQRSSKHVLEQCFPDVDFF